jgi:hypothetical protein
VDVHILIEFIKIVPSLLVLTFNIKGYLHDSRNLLHNSSTILFRAYSHSEAAFTAKEIAL